MMDMEKESIKPLMAHHLHEPMADVVIYGWGPLRAYHAVRLQQVKICQAQWDDMGAKFQFRPGLASGYL